MKIKLSITIGELRMLVKTITFTWPAYKSSQGKSIEEMISLSNLVDVWLKFTKRITSRINSKNNTKTSISITGNEYLALDSLFTALNIYNLENVTPMQLLAIRIYEESTNQLTHHNELLSKGLL